MDNKDLDNIFEGLNFDNEEPSTGHRSRFEAKIGKRKQPLKTNGRLKQLWLPFSGIAAILLISLIIFGELFQPGLRSNSDLAGISPEMRQTQEFYSSLIKREMNAIDAEKTPETKALVKDALEQLEKLENEYENLREDLVTSGKDNRVIHAMIQNFQQRIDLLTSVLRQIEEINSLKKKHHESTII
ncbi:hypothetical protein [Christiangramia salexigens]|uniref:Uncharacterized protein n=1 Tax=Christiangramia salexigens TaxID=1913577 RepID=A0A1L3J2P2_9FLAO|nr:hypothetical protein [Christiangramia salexigens]APG59394.1 hypothetical protein LPB144_02760 [Christiangramia salexigens]